MGPTSSSYLIILVYIHPAIVKFSATSRLKWVCKAGHGLLNGAK